MRKISKKENEKWGGDFLELFFTGVALCGLSWIVLLKFGENHFLNMQFFGVGFMLSSLVTLWKEVLGS